MPELVHRRTIWPQIVLLGGWGPVLLCFFWPVYFITAPATIALAIWKWKAPGSLVHGRRRVTMIFGLLGALLQIGGLAAFFYFVSRR